MAACSTFTDGIVPFVRFNSTNNATYFSESTATATALIEGAIVYDTTNDVLKVCDGTNWLDASGGGGASSGDAGYVQISDGSGGFTTSGTTAGQQFFWDNTNKRLGMGTASPAGLLDVTGGDVYLRSSARVGAITGISGNFSPVFVGHFGSPTVVLGDGGTLGVRVRANGIIGWSNSSGGAQTAYDTAITRPAAGILYIGNGTANDFSGTLIASNVGIGTTAPADRLEVQGGNISINGGVNPVSYMLKDSSVGSPQWALKSSSGRLTLAEVGVADWFNIVKTTGNVGIGTTVPSYLLSLGGNAARTVGMERHTTADTAGNALTVLAGGATSGATNKAGGDLVLQSGTATGTGTSKIEFKTHPAGSSGTADTTATTAMTILGSGNVGIGTTTPNATLSIATVDTLTRPAISLRNIGSSLFGFDIDIEQQSIGRFDLYSVANGSRTSRLSVDRTSGNVGIGTSAPAAPLQIQTVTGAISSFATTGASNVRIGGNNGTGPYTPSIVFDNGSKTWNIDNLSGGDDLRFVYNGSSVPVTFTDTGNVGIGTTTPQSKLDVAGGARVGADAVCSAAKAGMVAWNANTLQVCTDAGTFTDLANSSGLIGGSSQWVDGSGGAIYYNGGNVGIGTSTPAQTLDVAGAGVFTSLATNGRTEIWSTGPASGIGRTADGWAGHTLYADAAANTTYSTSLGRFAGANGDFEIVNRGTGKIKFGTNLAADLTIDGSGNVGIGTTAPSYLLSLGGNAARTVGMERHTTADTAGNALTVLAGGATSGATNKAGGDLVLSSGTATGTGTSKIEFKTHPAGSTGTADTTATTAMTILGNGSVVVSTGVTANDSITISRNGNISSSTNAGGTKWLLGTNNGNGTASINVASDSFFGFNSQANMNGGERDTGIFRESAGIISLYGVTGNHTKTTLATLYTGTLGVGTTTPNQGKVEVKGGTVCVDTDSDDNATSCIANESDVRLKDNVRDLSLPLDTFMKLRPVSFDWKHDDAQVLKHYPLISRFATAPHSIGMIAQEVQALVPEAILPETVGDGEVQYLQLDYTKLVPVLIKAVQDVKREKDAEVEALKAENEDLKKRLMVLERIILTPESRPAE